MTIYRGLAITGDVQAILNTRDFLQNDLDNKHPDVLDIEWYIDSIIDNIYMRLATEGYELPIIFGDSPLGYNYVRRYNAIGAAEMAERRLGGNEHADALLERYNKFLEDITSHDVILTDVPGAPLDSALAESGTSNLTAEGDEKDPFFTREQQF